MNNAFNQTSKIAAYGVEIGGIELAKESILSFEVYFKNDTPKVLCNLILNDIYDLSSHFVWRDQVVTVHYMDIYKEYTKKEYTILYISESYNNIKEKVITLELQDTFSHKLEHTYTSKGFTTNPIQALQSYIDDYLKLDYEFNSTSETDFTAWADGNYNFVVPNNINALDWFLHEFRKHGYTFYQTKTKICVKSLQDLLPTKLPLNDDTYFTNEVSNQFYKNIIHEIKVLINNFKEILPKTKTLAFDKSKKIMASYEINDTTQYALNDDIFNLQENLPAKHITQNHLNFNEHEMTLKNSFLKQAMLQIFVPGFIKNDLNQIYDIKLSGNKGIVASQASGNVVVSGKYISHTIADKLISDSLIQKIELHRVDLTKKIN